MNYRAMLKRDLQCEELREDVGEQLQNQSATWPIGSNCIALAVSMDSELDDSRVAYREAFRGDLAEFFEPDDTDTLRVFAEPDRRDTVPSPPPELDSAPWHDER